MPAPIWTASALLEPGASRRFAAGDREVIEQVLASLGPPLVRYLYRLCRQSEDAEDMAQETMAKVFLKAGQLRQPDRVRAWAFHIARNVYRMRQRAGAAQRACVTSLDQPAGEYEKPRAPHLADPALLPDEEAFWSEVRQGLASAIRALPESYRAVVLLRDVQGLSAIEAAELLEVSPNAVKTRLYRARQELRTRLEDYRLIARQDDTARRAHPRSGYCFPLGGAAPAPASTG